MSESTSNIKSVTYVFTDNSNIIKILKPKSEEHDEGHTLLFLKVYDV